MENTISKTNDQLSVDIQMKMRLAFELKQQFDELDAIIRDALKTAMIEHGIKSIKTDEFNVTLASRATYKCTGDIPADFQKISLDTARVGTYDKLNGELPDGIVKNEIQYIAYKNKVAQ